MISRKIIYGLLLLLAIVSALGIFLIIPHKSSKDIGPIENIKGIPFPQENGTILITEELAHTDIYLNEPRLGRQAKIKINFTPLATSSISVGIRENPFWLSYKEYPIYNAPAANKNESVNSAIQAEITIPLTDKILDQNNSLDLSLIHI